MAIYGYEAINNVGKKIKGSVEGESIDAVRKELKEKKLTVLSITEQNLFTRDLNIEIGGYPTPRDMAVFCRQFVSMIRAGVTILDALKMLTEATENKKLKEALSKVREDAEKGDALSACFQAHPKVFPPLLVNMTAAGEASGSIDISMERMAKQLERNSKTVSLIKKAMTYPIVVCLVAIAVIVLMLVVVIPAYTDMFAELGTSLPALTVAVVAMSDFVIGNWFFLIIVVGAVAAGITTFRKTTNGKYFFGKIALSIPAVKNLVTKNASAQLARTLSTLIAAGIPLVEAVEIAGGTMQNIYFKDAMMDAREEIMMGEPLSRPLQTCGLFPPMVYHMVKIGEETGNTEDMLDKLADYYEEEVEMAVQTLMAAMEPMIIVILALIVGVLLGACMAPMMELYSSLDNL